MFIDQISLKSHANYKMEELGRSYANARSESAWVADKASRIADNIGEWLVEVGHQLQEGTHQSIERQVLQPSPVRNRIRR